MAITLHDTSCRSKLWQLHYMTLPPGVSCGDYIEWYFLQKCAVSIILHDIAGGVSSGLHYMTSTEVSCNSYIT